MCFSVTAVTFLLLFPGFYSTMTVTTLQSFRGCAVRDFTFVAKKPGCRSLRISTEACWGRCHTWEVTETCDYILFIELLLLEYMFVYLFLHDIHVFLCVLASQRPVLEPPYIQRHHSVCTYSRTRHLTARLPGCRPGVSPIYHYPQALQCDCTYCSSNHTECETF